MSSSFVAVYHMQISDLNNRYVFLDFLNLIKPFQR